MTLISLIVTQKTETNLTCLSVVFQKWNVPYLNRLETMGINGLHTRANAGLTLKPSISKYKFSKQISVHFLNRFRDMSRRSKHFCFGDFLINSHNLFFWLCIDIVSRKYLFVTLEISSVKETLIWMGTWIYIIYIVTPVNKLIEFHLMAHSQKVVTGSEF